MKKRVLSLFFVLALLAGFVTVSVNAVDGNNINFRYYSSYNDGVLSNQITSVNVDEYFYVSVNANDFLRLLAFTIPIHFNSNIVKAVSFTTDGIITYEGNPELETAYRVTSTSTQLRTGINGLRRGDLFEDSIMNADEYPAFTPLTNVNTTFVDNINGLITLGGYCGEDVTIANNKELSMFIMKFKALATGDPDFDHATSELGGKYYNVGCPDGIMLTDTVITGTLDYNLNAGSFMVGSEAVPAAQNVSLDQNGNVAWDAVTEANGYQVVVYIRENGSLKDTKTYPADVNSFVLPEEIRRGDISVVIISNGDGVETADGRSAETAPVKFTKPLASPANVSWNGNTLTWDAVEGVTSYTVTLMENGVEVAGVIDLPVNSTSLDCTNYLKEPTDRLANTYIAYVTPVGDSYSDISNSTAASPEISLYGSVGPARNLTWSGNIATWTASVDADNVSGYEITVYEGGKTVYKNTVENTQMDLTSIINEKGPGNYSYSVIAFGVKTEEKAYKDSAAVHVPATKLVSATLPPVSDIVWNDTVVEWSYSANDKKGVSLFEIELYENGVAIGLPLTTRNNYIDLGDYITEGSYKAVIIAKGNGVTYLDSSSAESPEQSFAARLDSPAGVVWNGDIAKWDVVTGAMGYSISLYYMPEGETVGKLIPGASFTVIGVESYDFSSPINMLELIGTYTFKVKALGDNITNSSSKETESDTNIKTAAKVGNVTIELFESYDAGTKILSIPITKAKVGQEFYAAVYMDSLGAISSLTLPVSFDPEIMKVVDINNTEVESAVLSKNDFNNGIKGIIPGALFNTHEFTAVVNSDYPYVDNTNGLIKLLAYNGSEINSNSKETIVVIKFIALKIINGTTEIDFANNNDSYYDETVPMGATFGNSSGYVFTNVSNTTLGTEKGQLSKPNAPEWNGNVLSWEPVVGAQGYILRIYRDNVLIETLTLPIQTSYDAVSYLGSKGSYTADVTAIGDQINSDDSDPSDKSAAKVVTVSGGGGKALPTTPGTTKTDDDKTVTPTPGPGDVTLTDITGHWAEADILELVSLGIIEGYSDSTYRPDIGITRAEFTKLMVTSLGYDISDNDFVYTDTINHWAKDYISAGTKNGIVDGIGDNMFAPDEIITREQMATIIYRMVDSPQITQESAYSDREQVSFWAINGVDYAASEGIMIGFDDNTFRGAEHTNRAQAATVIARLIRLGVISNQISE